MKKISFLVFLLVVFLLQISVVSADGFGTDSLKLGSYGDEVRQLQLNLQRLGYFEGNPNGVFGNMTVDAVKRFQVNNGFIGTGQVDKPLFARIADTSGKVAEVIVEEKNDQVQSDNTEKETAHSSDAEMKIAQLALKGMGYYTGQIDGIYGPKTAAAIKQFQTNNNLDSDGTLSTETYEAIIAAGDKSKTRTIVSRSGTDRRQSVKEQTTEKSAEVELLDWWTEASQIFYIGAVANIIDVRTGKSFSLVRTYGTNHADAESLTKEDSEIIKELWGGQWSWDRRPVIVEVGDRRIAASIAAMPHAGLDGSAANAYVSNRSGGYGTGYNLDMIKNNDMEGHIDVHFLNSRTHGTNSVNKAHQEAIMEAFGYNQ